MAINNNKLDSVVANARKAAEQRGHGYRDRALGMYPWVCGRCAREFSRGNVSELTVHHRNHNHDDNPADGSNWELLCIYCHDNEHQKQIEADRGHGGMGQAKGGGASHSPFANLKALLKVDDKA